MNQRRQSREIALQALFHREFNKDIGFEQCLETFRTNFAAATEIWRYSLKILKGIEYHQQDIDSLLRRHSSHWSLDRMALVDLNILRIAVFEVVFSDDPIPPKVAINESLEIAKRYASTESASFLNGLLDKVFEEQIP